MSVTMQYRVTTKCDQCGKKVSVESIGYPPAGIVPVDWVQTAPPGIQDMKEFCSPACLSKWKPDIKPWKEDADE